MKNLLFYLTFSEQPAPNSDGDCTTIYLQYGKVISWIIKAILLFDLAHGDARPE